MPDFWTHLIAGEEIVKRLEDNKIRELLNQNYQLFNYGCQGADFFFYNDFLPWQKGKLGPKKGEMIHQLSGRKVFAELLTSFKKETVYLGAELPDSEYWQHNLVYLLGFISHYALDRECHPLIIKKGGRDHKHKLIEASIDIHIMQIKWQQSPTEVDPLPYYQLQENHFNNLKFFYQLIFENIFREEFDAQLLWDSYLDLRKYHKLFFVKSSAEYYLFKLLNLILTQNLSQYSYDLNEKEDIWPAENYQLFEKSFTAGINSALKLIQQTLEYFQSARSLSETLSSFGDKNFMGESS